jgi:hypothetical protein
MGWHARSNDFFVHVVCEVEDEVHHLVGGHEVVCVKGVDDALLGPTERAVAGSVTHHEQSQIVGVDGCGPIN